MEDPAVADADKRQRGASLARSVKDVLAQGLESIEGTFADYLLPLFGVLNKILDSTA